MPLRIALSLVDRALDSFRSGIATYTDAALSFTAANTACDL